MYLGISLAQIFQGGGPRTRWVTPNIWIFGAPTPLFLPPPIGYLPLQAISRPHKDLHIPQHFINLGWERTIQAQSWEPKLLKSNHGVFQDLPLFVSGLMGKCYVPAWRLRQRRNGT